MNEHSYDVVVVGAGPAGIAAATCAAELGRRTALVDDNAAPGGQIWRRSKRGLPASARHAAEQWLQRLDNANVDVLAGTTIVHADGPRTLYGDTSNGGVVLRNEHLVLATGSQERFLPFPGWTLPGVYGVGGLQALLKGGLSVRGRRVAVVGSGPLLWSVAADLRRRGGTVVCVAEQARLSRLLRFGATLAGHPGKLAELAGMAPALYDVPRFFSTWPARVEGKGHVEGLVLRSDNGSGDGKERRVACDVVACGFGLVADTRLASLLGCRVEDERVVVDDGQRTSVDGVWAAGETTGVGGAAAALVEGQIAGRVVAGRDVKQRRHRYCPPRGIKGGRHSDFAAVLARTFALRDELRRSVDDATVVCRCEDVAWREIKDARDLCDAKLRSRCGMGACQGRVCSPALAFLNGYRKSTAVRSPLYPVPMTFWCTQNKPTLNKERSLS